eukprot:TRINITY_DN11375_c0_g1_i3.p1 TRINITY_DN11375_c0_g1~~TRINITY_DN11375_c0_g1_i3.p1  ORF type:complete len:648 (+),score=108.11 TRINITY_DN11375_c0_g1_i3:105-1946(+)
MDLNGHVVSVNEEYEVPLALQYNDPLPSAKTAKLKDDNAAASTNHVEVQSDQKQLSEYLDADAHSALGRLLEVESAKSVVVEFRQALDKTARTDAYRLMARQWPWINFDNIAKKDADGNAVSVACSVHPAARPLQELLPTAIVNEVLRVGNNLFQDVSAVTLPAIPDKSTRKDVHGIIGKHFPLLETKTSNTSPGCIVVRRRPRRKRGKRDGKVSQDWRDQDDITLVAVTKVNVESHHLLDILARGVGIKPFMVGIAGTKDKLARTTQLVTISGVTPRKLLEHKAQLEQSGNIKLGRPCRAQRMLALGDLLGNRFTLMLRNVMGNRDDIDAALTRLSQDGFVNYYGQQRFGGPNSLSPPHLVGRLILQRQYLEAVRLMLAEDPADSHPGATRARQRLTVFPWSRQQLDQAVSMMPRNRVKEHTILKALKRFGCNEEGARKALQALPHTQRVFQLHAYTSSLWNKLAYARIKLHGLKVHPKDNILLDGQLHTVDQSPTPDQVSIRDVVVPIPGERVEYTEILSAAYQELISEDELTSDSFRIDDIGARCRGAHRSLLAHLDNVTWTWSDDTSLKLCFDLGKGSYATEALRSVLDIEKAQTYIPQDMNAERDCAL